jgi:acetolactate synthase-1/2/3 large subunit
MVAVQEESMHDRTSGVNFGPVDLVKYAEAFGAVGFMIEAPDQIGQTLKKAFEIPGPVLIGIRVDYRDNHKLFENSHEHLLDFSTNPSLRELKEAENP